jgi:uncharacterized repeat protein (TIGR01451 family)
VTIGEAKLSLTKTGPERRYVNLPTPYQITVANAGTVRLDSVMVSDPLPAKTVFVSASSGGRLVGGEVQWPVGPLGIGESRTVDVVIRAQEAGRICNHAEARAERGRAAQAEACTDFVGVAALLLEVVDIDDPVEVGGETSYVILVRNQGTDPATNVRVEALVPPQLAITRVTGPSDNRREGQRIFFQPLTLPSKGEARYQVYVKALQPGDVRFKVDLTADQLTSGPVHEEESTTLYRDVPNGRQPPDGLPRARRRVRP